MGEVVWEKAESTNEQDDVDGRQSFPLANAVFDLGDPPRNERVADQNDGKRDDKTKHQGQDVVKGHARNPAAPCKVLKTHGGVSGPSVVEGTTKNERNHDAQGNHPKEGGHHHVVSDPDLDVREGVQHCNVTINTDAGEKDNA